MLSSHLNVLESSSIKYSTLAAFRTPQIDISNNRIESWNTITYEQFRNDVERSAKFWLRALKRSGIPQRSVIGLWISGFTYDDVLHIYGISRAGYIPQLFSLRLPNPVVIYELLQKANAKALVHDATFEAILKDCPLPTFVNVGPKSSDLMEEPLPEMPQALPEDTVFIFHTSGSTSGSPKLVPCSYQWLNSAIEKSRQISKPRNAQRQDVTVWMGSMCHIAQTFMLLGSLQYGSCTVQPTIIAFSSEELVDMIHRCRLNRLNQFPTFLANHLRKSRTDAKLLSMLSSLDEVIYSGLPLAHEEGDWAQKNGINVTNLFGSTECGAMLLSVGKSARNPGLLRPLEGCSYRFIPATPAQSETGQESTARLLELVILAESPDCPDISLRSADGHFHTGDLFQEPSPGLYVFRGRDDDWIKSENSLRCDTKAIEDNVRAMCGALIAECVVVGSGRPSPVMFIEPAGDMDGEKLKKEIIRKTRQFHSRRYLHERITSTNMIVVVPRQSLPRTATKGNIRRKAVEEAHKTLLDDIYARSR